MLLNDAKTLTQDLMAVHLDSTWTFNWINAKQTLGRTSFFPKYFISLSRPFATVAEEDEVAQVILHEIAHALAGPHAGHGPEWKKVARDLGVRKPASTINVKAMPPAVWSGTCPQGHHYSRNRRRTGAIYTCPKCPSGQNYIRWVDNRLSVR